MTFIDWQGGLMRSCPAQSARRRRWTTGTRTLAILAAVMVAASSLVQASAAKATVSRDQSTTPPFVEIIDLGPVAKDASTGYGPFAVRPWQQTFQGSYANVNRCLSYTVCIGYSDGFRDAVIVFGGDYVACQGWRWEGTIFSNHTYSFWNRTSGTVSVWDRYLDGSYRYHRMINAPSGYRHDTHFSEKADAWVYDPRGDCRSLNLRHIDAP